MSGCRQQACFGNKLTSATGGCREKAVDAAVSGRKWDESEKERGEKRTNGGKPRGGG